MNDHSRHGAARAAGEHRHELHEAAGHADHGHEHLGHAGHADVYRRRFWITLILAVPVVVYSEMIQDWFGFTAPQFPGDGLMAPVLGAVIFFYGGSVFLTGAWSELRRRPPGMMLLVSLAISVAFLASAASALGLVDLEFWWELSALVVIMLLGHWQEMKALGQARGALSALAELLPDEAERLRDGETERVSLDQLEGGDIVLVRPGARVPADGEVLLEGAVAVHVVVPVRASHLHFLTNDEAEERRDAEQTMLITVGLLRQSGIRATGAVGSDKPLESMTDALGAFPATHVLLATPSAEESYWLERDLLAKARALTELRVTQATVASGSAGQLKGLAAGAGISRTIPLGRGAEARGREGETS